VDLGFRTERLLLADAAVPLAVRETARRHAFYRTCRSARGGARRAVSGGRDGRAVCDAINGGYAIEGGLAFEEMGVRSPRRFHGGDPAYFATLGVPMWPARLPRRTRKARRSSPWSTRRWRASFADRDPLGHRITCRLDGTSFGHRRLVANVRSRSALPPQPQLKCPSAASALCDGADRVMRTTSDRCCCRKPSREVRA
jgi:hypothetical protein